MAATKADPPPSSTSPESAIPPEDPLVRLLAADLGKILKPSSAIVCVGNELRGDDAAGVVVGRELTGWAPWTVFNALTVPENCLMRIVTLAPESVLFIDALHFNAPPGTVRLFAPADLDGAGPSTHGPSPRVFLQALKLLHPCDYAVLGIQPGRLDFDCELSPLVDAAVQRVILAFDRLAHV